MDENYNTNEVDTNMDNDGINDCDEGQKFPMSRVEDMSTDFNFKLGMEFCLLKEFKQAIMEHSILNGR